jgi:hypothetical protein
MNHNHWRAQISGKSLGTFDTLEEAAISYDQAAIKIFGKFAILNIIIKEDQNG